MTHASNYDEPPEDLERQAARRSTLPSNDVRCQAMTIQPLAHSLKDVAEQLGISTRSIYRLIDSGALLAVHVGGRRMVRQSDLVAYVDGLTPSEPAAS